MTTILANFGQELVIGVQETDVFRKNRRQKPTFWPIQKNSQIEKIPKLKNSQIEEFPN